MNRIQNKAFALVNRSFINKILPPYAVLPLILCPIINMVVYNGAPGTGLDPGLLGMLSGVDCQLHFSLSGEQGSVL